MRIKDISFACLSSSHRTEEFPPGRLSVLSFPPGSETKRQTYHMQCKTPGIDGGTCLLVDEFHFSIYEEEFNVVMFYIVGAISLVHVWICIFLPFKWHHFHFIHNTGKTKKTAFLSFLFYTNQIKYPSPASCTCR